MTINADADPTGTVAFVKQRLRDKKSRLLISRRLHEQRLARAQAQAARANAELAKIDAALAREARKAAVLDGGWAAWQPDPKATGHRVTPLPRGALSKGALKALRLGGRRMTAKEVTAALFVEHGFPVPLPQTLAEIATRVTANLARHEGIYVERGRIGSGHVWTALPLAEVRRRQADRLRNKTRQLANLYGVRIRHDRFLTVVQPSDASYLRCQKSATEVILAFSEPIPKASLY